MKYLKTLGIAAVAAMALTASTAALASATTLEVGGVTQNLSIHMEAGLESGTSLRITRTDGSLANTCSTSNWTGSTNSFTGSSMTAPLSTLSFSSCERSVNVHKAGTLHLAHIAGTTNATVTSSEAEMTVGSIFGTLNCKTGSGTDLGTLRGTASGGATLEVNALVNCGFLVPSARWLGSYSLYSPGGFGVSS